MERKYKVYVKRDTGAEPVLVTPDYTEACVKASELTDKGQPAFVWEV